MRTIEIRQANGQIFVAKAVVICVLLVFLGGSAVYPTPSRAASNELTKILFFDPDANHNAIGTIIAELTRYLRESGITAKIEAVSDNDSFRNSLLSGQHHFALVTSSVMGSYGDLGVEPLLVPEANGEIYYHKVLVDNGKGTKDSLRGQRIGVVAGADNLLRALSRSGIDTNGAILLRVSKDLDATLALAFGQVQAALVTPQSLAVLQTISPVFASNVRELWKSEPILRTPLCAVGRFQKNPAERRGMIKAFAEMANSPSGKNLMRILGYDGWRSYSGSNMSGTAEN